MVTRAYALERRMPSEPLAYRAAPEPRTARRVCMEVVPGPCARQETDQFGLTARERDVLCLMARRQTDAEIADQLYISYRTVTTHVSRIIEKLGVRNRRDAGATAVRHGLIEMCA